MRRTFFAVFVIEWVILSSISFGATYGGGSGTADDPYQIWTAEQMNSIGANPADWGKYFLLMADIDVSVYAGMKYNIIGNSSTKFTGTFDGNGYKIKRLHITGQGSYVGLFGYASGATIKNLGIENFSISVSAVKYTYIGSLVGYQSNTTITNCYGMGTIVGYSSYSSPSYIGGLVGWQDSGVIVNCSCTGSVSSNGYDYSAFCGGLVGFVASGVITDSSSKTSVAAETNSTYAASAGGLVYFNAGTITNCYSTGAVSGISATSSYVGGLVATNQGTIINSYSSGPVTSTASNSSQSNTAIAYAGGLVAYQSGLISNCYSTGTVHGTSSYSTIYSGSCVGGLVAYQTNSSAKIEKSYSTGKVTASGQTLWAGGFLGALASGTVLSSFWDTQTSGLTTSIGGTGKTTAQMKTQSTFTSAGWDFTNTWYMVSYPALKWEINPLQAQIDAASNGTTITVQPGTYQGRLYFKGKNITLISTDPQDPNIVASTIIQGRGSGSVITFAGTETSACVLSGFTITGGCASQTGGGGINGNLCTAAIRNCFITKNNSQYAGGGIWGINGLISNCLVRDNQGSYGGAIAKCNGLITNTLMYNNQASIGGSAINNCDGVTRNCTVMDGSAGQQTLLINCDGVFENCILVSTGTIFDICTSTITYSCYPGATGTGNISADPMFVNPDPNYSDYHLLSGSPCIDAGDPASDYSNEPWPNGSRVDMGAYGNTPEATLSSNVLIPLGFQIVDKTRAGRIAFEYELAVVVRNPNEYDMTNVQMQLKAWDAAVQSVLDDSVSIDSIPSGATVTSTDTFRIIVDRSQLIVPGMLTWELTYYTAASGDQIQQAMMSMPLSTLDAVAGDISGDGNVNMEDFAIMAAQWNGVADTPSADIALPLDGYVGIEDLIYLAENWLN